MPLIPLDFRSPAKDRGGIFGGPPGDGKVWVLLGGQGVTDLRHKALASTAPRMGSEWMLVVQGSQRWTDGDQACSMNNSGAEP